MQAILPSNTSSSRPSSPRSEGIEAKISDQHRKLALGDSVKLSAGEASSKSSGSDGPATYMPPAQTLQDSKASLPTTAKKLGSSLLVHGQKIDDPYAWLRDKKPISKEITEHLQAENQHFAAFFESRVMCRKQIQEELLAYPQIRAQPHPTIIIRILKVLKNY